MMYNDYITKEYDNFFSKETFTWLPWVGRNYPYAQIKLLIIGESNYDDNPDKIEKDRNFTRKVIDDFQISFAKMNQTFKGFDKLLDLKSKEEIRNFWSNVAFYDFVQRAMLWWEDKHGKSNTEKPTPDDCRKGIVTFNSIIDILQPDFVLCIGVKSLDHVIKFNDPNISRVFDHDKIGSAYPREVKLQNGCKVLAVNHTSNQISNSDIEEWRKLIYQKFPGLKSFINDIKYCESENDLDMNNAYSDHEEKRQSNSYDNDDENDYDWSSGSNDDDDESNDWSSDSDDSDDDNDDESNNWASNSDDDEDNEWSSDSDDDDDDDDEWSSNSDDDDDDDDWSSNSDDDDDDDDWSSNSDDDDDDDDDSDDWSSNYDDSDGDDWSNDSDDDWSDDDNDDYKNW